jgi:predicted flap endonuclease-1-like 5' DNA nuclease
VTQANRPALVGRCATCGVELVRFSGARVSGAPSFSFRLLPAQRPVVLASLTMTRAATAAGEQSKARAAVMTPLTAIPGIGEARARRLAEVGIDTIHKLVAARPEDVARALKRSGVSEKHAAGFIERAKQRLASWEKS